MAEIRYAGIIAEHNLPMNLMEHLPRAIMAANVDSSIAKKVKCSRTKVTAIIKNVIGSSRLDSIIKLLNSTQFSLIIDESTDRTQIKHLCLLVRLSIENKIKDIFLTLIEVDNADATSLFNHIIGFFKTHNIDYKKNLIGFGGDGANVIMGVNHSVSKLLKDECPNIFILKCICHSFHLCASYACKELPSAVEDLICDIYNFIQKSPKRISQFQSLQKIYDFKPHKILHPCQTRWLSLLPAVSRIREQYEVLKHFFRDKACDREDKSLAAASISMHLNNPETLLYLNFLEFVLPFFNDLNKLLQSEKPKVHLLYKEISTITRTLLSNYMKASHLDGNVLSRVEYLNPRQYLPLEEMYFGSSFLMSVKKENIYSDFIPKESGRYSRDLISKKAVF